MNGHTPSPLTYLVVFALLVLLTIGTVGVSLIPMEGHWHIVAGLIIATIKASLVVLFFMHALASPQQTKVVILVAASWLVLLVGLTFTDYATRGLISALTRQ
jgi:cytochrome c oxidase subunit 4